MRLDLEQRALIRRTITRQFTEDEHQTFIAACESTGLNPFTGQIYAVGRWDKQASRNIMAVQPSIDSYRVAAARSGAYAGQIGPLWLDAQGNWHDVWLSSEPPVAAKVAVLRKGFPEPIWAVARWSTYVQKTREGNPMGQWRTSPEIMIANAAERLAMRRAGFILDITDGDIEGEIDVELESETPAAPIHPVANEPAPAPKPEPTPAAAAPVTPPAAPESTEPEVLSDGQVVRLNRTLTDLGLKADDRPLKLRLINYLLPATESDYGSSKDVPARHFELLRKAFDELLIQLKGHPHDVIVELLEHLMDNGIVIRNGAVITELKALLARREEARKALEAEANKPDPEPEGEDWLDRLPDGGHNSEELKPIPGLEPKKEPEASEDKPKRTRREKPVKPGDLKPIKEAEALAPEEFFKF